MGILIISAKKVSRMEVPCMLALEWLSGLGVFGGVAGEEEGGRNVTLVCRAQCTRR